MTRTKENIIQKRTRVNVDTEILNFIDELNQQKPIVCLNENCISEKTKKSISKYLEIESNDTTNRMCFLFDSIYSFDKTKCNLSCIRYGNEPSRLIKYIISTKNYYGVSYECGGIGVTNWFTAFKKINDSIISHWTVSIQSNDLNDLNEKLLVENMKISK